MPFQAPEVDDVPLLRASARSGTATGLKATGSGSLAVAMPEERRRWVILAGVIQPAVYQYTLHFKLLLGAFAYGCKMDIVFLKAS